MAKYHIEYCCGHTATVQLYGKIKERESYIEWARDNKLCPECYEKERAAARQKQNEDAQNDAMLNHYPQLTGSDKQIAWANTLRMKAVEEVKGRIEEIVSIKQMQDDMAGLLQQVLNNAVQSQTDSKFWIDNRFDFGSGWQVLGTFLRLSVNSELFDKMCRAEADSLVKELEGHTLEELEFVKDLTISVLAKRLYDQMFLWPDESEKVAEYFLASETVKHIKEQLNN